jgi:transposase-like protein
MPSPQQSLAANNILEVFAAAAIRYAMLIALCQAGKTGAFQELIRLMLSAGIANKVYILCGSNETELRDQAHEDTEKANLKSYTEGIITVLFRQDFKNASMDIANSLIIVDESHMDQTQKQELDIFLGRHGLTMDGNPKTLNEKNAFIVSVDATPYSELAALEHKESYKKHVEVLEQGADYYGLADYFYDGRIQPAFDLAKILQFVRIVMNGGKKYALMRFTNGKHAAQQEAAAIKVYTRLGGKVYYYTAEKTEIAITAAQKAKLGLTLCLEDAPSVPSLVIIRGRLRAGKVVPKMNISFVWEGAKVSKTDSLVQGLVGRMCGYAFGDEKPLIFLPPSSLKRHENKVIKLSEIERAIMSYPFILPTMATHLKKGHVATAATNGKTQCPPLRLTWDADDDEWTFTEKFEEKFSRGEDRKDIQQRCHALLLKNLVAIQESPNYSAEQKKEILETIVPAGANHAHIRNLHGDSQVTYFKQLREGHSAGTAPSENIDPCDPLNFVITYRGYKAEYANHRHLYVVFYTDATNGVTPSLMAVDLKSRIPLTDRKSVFSIHDSQVAVPLVAGGVTGFDETKLKNPVLMEACLREYLRRYKDSELLTTSRCIQSNKDRFLLSKKEFHYASSKNNDVEVICAKLSREFGVKMKVTYTRSGSTSFNVKKIEW